MAKKTLGEGITALSPEDVVKAYEEVHPNKKRKKIMPEAGSDVPKETEADKPVEIQLTDLEQLKKDVDAALSLLPRVKALLAQIVILPETANSDV